MPQWGRPPRGLDRKARREWEMQQMREWEEANHRFEELDSDEESEADRLQFTNYDLGSRRQAVAGVDYDHDLAYGDRFEDEEYDGWQLAQREKEEELADRAARRISRARLKGYSNVDLTREELDALERREQRQALVQARQQKQATVNDAPPSKKRSKGGLFSKAIAPKPKPAKEKRVSVPVSGQRRISPPELLAHSSDSSPALNRTSPRNSRNTSGSRPAPARTSGQPPYPSLTTGSAYYDDPQGTGALYRPSSSSTYLPQQRRRDISPTRSLPDDPNWVPGGGGLRSRSSSSAHLNTRQPPYPTTPGDPYAYQTYGPAQSRRNVSGPAAMGVSYSSVRRMPPQTSQTPADATRVPSDERLHYPRVPVGSRDVTGASSSQGRLVHKEVIEISSDDDDEGDVVNQEEESDDESDEGVRVDVIEEPRGGVAVGAAGGRGVAANTGRGRGGGGGGGGGPTTRSGRGAAAGRGRGRR
ncbi:MAG: hypothetical protein M1831_002498 [Alyxoria varia]|nr:MAG: hypothetical protein M1831_002498 [Alyxoria varia]